MKGEEVYIETPFLITTNLESRSERAGDREDLILFEIPTASPEEMIVAEKKVGLPKFAPLVHVKRPNHLQIVFI